MRTSTKVFREAMLRWVEPGGVGRETLDRTGSDGRLPGEYRRPVRPRGPRPGVSGPEESSISPRQRGPRLLLKKHLVRTGLRAVLRDLRTFLARYYGADGTLSRKAVARDARHLSRVPRPRRPAGASRSSSRPTVDPDIDSLFNGRNGDVSAGNWVEASFRRMTERVCDGIL